MKHEWSDLNHADHAPGVWRRRADAGKAWTKRHLPWQSGRQVFPSSLWPGTAEAFVKARAWLFLDTGLWPTQKLTLICNGACDLCCGCFRPSTISRSTKTRSQKAFANLVNRWSESHFQCEFWAVLCVYDWPSHEIRNAHQRWRPQIGGRSWTRSRAQKSRKKEFDGFEFVILPAKVRPS